MNLEAFGPVHAVGTSNAPALEGRGLTKTAVQGAAQIHERLGVLVEVAALSVVAVASASRLDDAAFLSKRRDAAGKAGACLARIPALLHRGPQSPALAWIDRSSERRGLAQIARVLRRIDQAGLQFREGKGKSSSHLLAWRSPLAAHPVAQARAVASSFGFAGKSSATRR